MAIQLSTIEPKVAVKNLLRLIPGEAEIDNFKHYLQTLIDNIKVDEKKFKGESEEHLKAFIRDFLRDTFYKSPNELNTKDRQDLVIFNENSKVSVIIEAKRPGNTKEMLSDKYPNTKAFHELILYYLDERQAGNTDIRYLIATNINEWYIFDASDFNRLFETGTFLKEYKSWRDKQKTSDKNDFFYNDIAKPYLETLTDELSCIYINIKDFEKHLKNVADPYNNEIVNLYKLLSPYFFLKKKFADDSNDLDPNFYRELLHIIGLEETKIGGKVLIGRKAKKDEGSLIELAIDLLKIEGIDKVHDAVGNTIDEKYFNIALELCITWINRILFLKLLEGQIKIFHKNNTKYNFLNSERVENFTELFSLFHKVLAMPLSERTESINTKFHDIPYLNSSLFEISDLEKATIKISELGNNAAMLGLCSTTILAAQKKTTSQLPTLDYLFRFLDAYNFATDIKSPVKKDEKRLITASVLGKVFEKINGYEDGSIFTPSFITMYMCRETIRMAIVQKFNDALKWKCTDFNALIYSIDDSYKSKEKRSKYNEIVNSITICDPAVGSGHFLVSALNELIAIKHDLKILSYRNGDRIMEWDISLDNDELIIKDEESKLYSYSLSIENKGIEKLQKLQEALFHEKETLIEKCLFGVDINPKSVMICRLRLWIELLKNAYYKRNDFNELETLPNIDINIKCGNSLVSRFKLDDDLKKALKSIKWSIKQYREFVNEYRHADNREVRSGFKKLIDAIKNDFRTEIGKNDPLKLSLNKKSGELYTLLNQALIFEDDKKIKKELQKKKEALESEIDTLTKQLKDIENNEVYKNAFEWRFEFPEVLDNNGAFIGFDIVVANPPYGVSLKGSLRDTIVNRLSKVPDYEIYYFFINLSKLLLKRNGIKTFIIPNTILFNVFAKEYRMNLFQNWHIQEILDCTDFNIFEGSATVRCIITQFVNRESDNVVSYKPTANAASFEELANRNLNSTTKEILLENNQNWALVFKLSLDVLQLTHKIKSNKTALEKHFPNFSQGLIAYDKYQGQDEYTIKNRIYHSIEKLPGWKKWLWGEDITPYLVQWNGKEYINYKKGIANPREQKYFKGERILVREITNPKIFAGYTDEEGYNDPAIINILKNEGGDIELKTLLAILNSKLGTFYHFNASPKATKGAFPKILVQDIKTFPLPSVTSNENINIIKLVDKIIAEKKKGKDTIKLEAEIDKLVYKLYDLTRDEIKIIEESI